MIFANFRLFPTLPQAKQLEHEEQLLDAERKNALSSLKHSLAEETSEALKEQEKQMGETIARLQVGQARRQAIIKKQDKTIKELEVSYQVNNYGFTWWIVMLWFKIQYCFIFTIYH